MAKKQLNTARRSPEINSARKVEVVGIIVIAIAILLGISIFSYIPEDYRYARSLSFTDIFNPDANSRLVKNWLGPVGAYISHLLVYSLFGYTSIFLAIIIGYNGWHIFRHRSFKENSWLNILSIWGMVLLSTFIGWLNTNANFPEDSVWSGVAGIAISRILQNITGVGSVFILSVLMLVTLLLLWDSDLQKTIDNVKIWMDNLREKMEASRIVREEKKAQKIAKREDRIAEKKAEIALKKEQKASEKAEKERQQKIKTRQIAETKSKAATDKPQPSIDEIVEKSEQEDRKRIQKEKSEVKTPGTRTGDDH